MNQAAQWEMFSRSFFLGSIWSFERMQGLGLAFTLAPWLREKYPDRGELIEALERHQGFFNANQAVSGVVIGVICALEEKIAQALPEERAEKISRMLSLKDALSRTLSAVADPLFLGVMRPFCMALALCAGFLAAMAVDLGSGAMLLSAGFYMVAYAAPSLWLRFNGIRRGYEWGENVVERLKPFSWQKLIRRLRLSGFALSVLFCLFLGAPFMTPDHWRESGPALAILAACFIARLFSVSTARIYGGLTVLGLLLAVGGRL